MKQFLLLIFFSLFIMAQTQINDSQNESSCSDKDLSLDQFQWENRIIVMFAPDSNDGPYAHQMINFSSLEDELLDRDLILISIFDEECAKLDDEIISDSSADHIQSRLSPSKEGYSIYLIGKDGSVKLKQDEVIPPDELFNVIDRMPMRHREMRDGEYRN